MLKTKFTQLKLNFFSQPRGRRIVQILRYGGGVLLLFVLWQLGLIDPQNIDLSLLGSIVTIAVLSQYFYWTSVICKKLTTIAIPWEELLQIIKEKRLLVNSAEVNNQRERERERE